MVYPNHCGNLELFARKDSKNEKKDAFIHRRFVGTMCKMSDPDS